MIVQVATLPVLLHGQCYAGSVAQTPDVQYGQQHCV